VKLWCEPGISICGMWQDAQLFFETVQSRAFVLPLSEWQARHLGS
jgi:hypothetical protein